MNAPGKIRWSILVATQASRTEFLKRLLRVLEPQVTRHEEVELIVRVSNPEIGLGDNRQLLREQARGMYSNFVDDDDLVSPDYVARILPFLDGVDYLSYEFQEYADGVPRPPTHVSLYHGTWYQDKAGLWRDIVHFCPVKTAMALLAPMEGGWGEDTRWTNQMRNLEVIQTEHHVDAVMHFLYFRSKKTDGAKTFSTSPRPAAIVLKPAKIPTGPGFCPCCGAKNSVVISNGGPHCNQCGREVSESMRAPRALIDLQEGAGQ
jgi:hypothetical protein